MIYLFWDTLSMKQELLTESDTPISDTSILPKYALLPDQPGLKTAILVCDWVPGLGLIHGVKKILTWSDYFGTMLKKFEYNSNLISVVFGTWAKVTLLMWEATLTWIFVASAWVAYVLSSPSQFISCINSNKKRLHRNLVGRPSEQMLKVLITANDQVIETLLYDTDEWDDEGVV